MSLLRARRSRTQFADSSVNTLSALLELQFLDNPLRRWALALLAFAVTFTVLPIVRSYVSAWGQRLARTAGAGADKHIAVELVLQLIPRTSRVFVLVVALNAAERLLVLPEPVHRMLTVLIVVGVWYQLGRWCVTTIEFFIARQMARDAGIRSSLAVIRFVVAFIVWVSVILLALDNLNVDITTLVAGLGIGGIAVALAVQTVLGDLLASLSIALDKPFAVGDQLLIDDFQGQVEHIGVKSTRLRSIGGEQIILANADVLKSRIRNFGRMEERRGVLSIGVTYETPQEKLSQAANLIKAAIESQPRVRLDRCHLKNFGAFAVEFEAVFFVLDAGMHALMDAQQEILLRIFAAFAEHGIQFAYPTQRLLLERAAKPAE